MLALYALLTLMGMRGVLGEPEMVNLDLSSMPSEQFSKVATELDNVMYSLFQPKSGYTFGSVTHLEQTVWKSSCKFDRAKFALMAYEKGVPALLYIRTELYNYYNLYFVRTGNSWTKTTLDVYKDKLSDLRSVYKTKDFTLNLDFSNSTEKFFFDPTNNFKRYDTFTPNLGHRATKVFHGVVNLWTASRPDERAVAAWAYKYMAKHFMVRVLVANDAGNFRFFNFFRVNNLYVDVEKSPFNFLTADDTKFPEDFYFPQFTQSKPSPNLSVVKFGENLTHKDDFLDSSFRFKPETTAKDYDFKYHNAPIPYKSCQKLDFSRRVPGSVGVVKNSVLENDLNVATYYPKSGFFFGTVADGSSVLFNRNLDSEACIGVHFYKKRKDLYLADVLVTSPHNPRSEYYVKEGSKWHLVNKGRFLELLEHVRA